MSEIRPFRALRYDPARCDLGRVLVPPYDVVAAHERADFYERDPHNAIRLELTRRVEDERSTDYRELGETLRTWQQAGVLRRDDAPAFYALRQEFALPDGGRGTRDGFFGLIRLEPYERRVVRPHERTMRGPVEDRLKVLRAAEANLSPVFFLYEDSDAELDALLAEPLDARSDAGPGVIGVDAAGTRNELVPLTSSSLQAQIAKFMSERPVVIADGHHRYETALGFLAERPELTGARFLLGYFANAYSRGTSLLPIHRVLLRAPADGWVERIAALPGWSAARLDPAGDAPVSDWLARHLGPLADAHAFAAEDAGGHTWLFQRRRVDGDALSIRVIHDEILRDGLGIDAAAVRDGAIAFPKSASETARMVREGEGSLALFLNPLTAREVFAVTGAGEVLPQKSTFFYPKLPSGLLFRLLADE